MVGPQKCINKKVIKANERINSNWSNPVDHSSPIQYYFSMINENDETNIKGTETLCFGNRKIRSVIWSELKMCGGSVYFL